MTKACPYCGEQIQATAIKCRYCAEWLADPAQPEAAPQDKTVMSPPPVAPAAAPVPLVTDLELVRRHEGIGVKLRRWAARLPWSKLALLQRRSVLLIGAGVLLVLFFTIGGLLSVRRTPVVARAPEAPPPPTVPAAPRLPEAPPPPSPAPEQAARKEAAAPQEPDKTPKTDQAEEPEKPPETFEEILKLTRPMMEDTHDEHNKGTLFLLGWAVQHMKWTDVHVEKDEISLGAAFKDTDEARGKRICYTGTIRQIWVDRSLDKKFSRGLLAVGYYDSKYLFFLAAGSSGDLVAHSRARLCGVITGGFEYTTVIKGTNASLAVVGMFDLPENKPLPKVLALESEPPGATVIVDGRTRGRTPVEVTGLDFKAAHRVEMRLRGYEPQIGEVAPEGNWKVVGRKELRIVRVELRPVPKTEPASRPAPVAVRPAAKVLPRPTPIAGVREPEPARPSPARPPRPKATPAGIEADPW